MHTRAKMITDKIHKLPESTFANDHKMMGILISALN